MENSESLPPFNASKAKILARLYDRALEEVIQSIRAKIADGHKPNRSGRPNISIRDNGMPSVTDKPLFGGNGPLEYSTVLEPPWNDEPARREGKFSDYSFPALTELKQFVLGDPEVSVLYMEKPHDDLLKIIIELGIERAANQYFLKFGERASDEKSRSVVLRPLMVGLTAARLVTPVVVPIALTRFSFDRARLAGDAIIIKMSDGLQRARWEGKAYAANGHDAVLAAATHALVLTHWSIPNSPKLSLGQVLSRPFPQISKEIDSFFASLRLELGIDTGYAQEIRLAKGWCTYGNLDEPEIFTLGARRYPAHFDDYGWTRDDLPLVDRANINCVAKTWAALRSNSDQRLSLALRRLNTAMTRDEPADAILDATIALEILLGDGQGEAISWKLRMRAAALVGIDYDSAKMEEMRKNIKDVYETRSAIVHGGRSRSAPSDDGHKAAQTAINNLRTVIKLLVAHPEFLDSQRIDSELLLSPRG